MDIYRVTAYNNAFYVSVLTYNANVHCGRQWSYLFVTDHYPTSYINQAKKFDTYEEARKWINDHEVM